MLNKLSEYHIYLLIILAGVVLFVPFIGMVHLFDWDEINFAEAAREMIVSGNYLRVQIDYEPFWEKPPLFIWMQVLSMKAFGINEFAARFPNAIIGIVTLCLVYAFGRRLFDRQFGVLWAAFFAASILPGFYFRTGIIDPLFNIMIFLGIVFLAAYYREYEQRPGLRGYRLLVLAGLSIGLAVLTKGPVGYLLPMISWFVFWLMRRREYRFPVVEGLLVTAAATVAALCWFGVELAKNGTWFLEQFIAYQIRLFSTGDAGHGQPVYYHPLVLFFGCFPASALIYSAFKRRSHDSAAQQAMKVWMIILFAVVLTIFSIVKTKIVHYSSLTYYPITFLAAYAMYRVLYCGEQWRRHASWLLGILGVLWSIVLIALPLLFKYRDLWMENVKDQFVRGNLSMHADWSSADTLPGILLLISIIVVLVLLRRQAWKKGMGVLLVACTLVFASVLPVLTPKVEKHTQGAVIRFYQTLIGRDCYVKVLGFKSYAHLYYIDKRPEQSPSSKGIAYDDFEGWLLEGKIDHPAYFVCKVQDVPKFERFTKKKELGRMGGFVFYVREPD